MNLRTCIETLVLAVLAATPPGAGAASGQVALPEAIQAFSSFPDVIDVSVSPDRRFLVFVTAKGDVRSVVVRDRLESVADRIVFTDEKRPDLTIRSCSWASPTRLICAVEEARVGVGPGIATARFFTRLVAVNHDGTGVLRLVDERGEALPDRIIHWNPGPEPFVIAQARAKYNFAYRVNIETGALDLVARMERSSSFTADANGEVRLGRVIGDRASEAFYFRLIARDDWRLRNTIVYGEEASALRPLIPIADKNEFLGLGPHKGTLALYDVHMLGFRSSNLLFSAGTFDVEDVEVNRFGKILGVRYQGERPQIHYFDTRAASVAKAADRYFPGAFNSIHDMTPDGTAYVIRSASDVDPGSFHVLDATEASPQFEQVSGRDRVLPDNVARMQSVQYPARDGTIVPAYLTVPVGANQLSAMPLVVMPHDGPSDRTRWEYDYLRAFLADRGYAVLEMNYRGSTGYGFKWHSDGFQQWHGVIHDDIVDGTRWAIERKIADPKRICIVGRGFGGVQSLMSAFLDPGVYQCAISIGAWTNQLAEQRDSYGWMGRSFDRKDVGVISPAKMRKYSPYYRASDFSIPVLLVHAELDANVPLASARSMAHELQKFCKPHELLVIKGADERLSKQSSRATLLAEIESFLGTHMTGAASSATGAIPGCTVP